MHAPDRLLPGFPASTNPYRTARVHALPPVLTEPLTAITARFHSQDRRGVLVGRHGSGKTSLLTALVPMLEAQVGPACWLRLRRDPAANRQAFADMPARIAGLLVIDGLEQLGPWAWWRLQRRATAIIATSHRCGRLPLLYRHETSAELLRELVRQLDGEPPVDAEELVAHHAGDLRRRLRVLYDRAADLRAAGGQPPACAGRQPNRRSRSWNSRSA